MSPLCRLLGFPPVLWPVKGICLNVWGDADLSEHGWGERDRAGAGTYFKTWLFVLVKAHSDSSTTGHLSWTQPSSETRVKLIQAPPSMVAPGPLALESCMGCPVHTGLTGAILFFVFFSSPFFVLVSVSFALSLCPPKKTQDWALLGCQEKEGQRLIRCLFLSLSLSPSPSLSVSLSLSLSAVPE